MQCFRPMVLNDRLVVPCGKCRACRIARAREWSVRCVHETMNHEGSVFATLTYSDDKIPENAEISKRELQLFIKRLRKEYSGKKVKYFACGEYGDQTGRPHYHAIIFGSKLSEHECKKSGRAFHCLAGPILKAWNKGYVFLGDVTYESARYVADYVQKDTRAEVYEGRTPPFSLKSQGIGKEYAIRNSKQMLSNLNVTMQGKNVGFPRYYQKILEVNKYIMREKREELIQATEDMLSERCENTREKAYEYQRIKRQQEINLKGFEALYSKGDM